MSVKRVTSSVSSSTGTTLETRPSAFASCASTTRPVKHRSRATPPPTMSCSGPYTTSPNSISGWEKRAVSAATRTSDMTARSNPPAMAGPLTAATSGSGNRSTVAWNRSLDAHSRSVSSGCWNSRRSKPALKTSPAPVMTTVLTASSPASSSSASDISSRTAIDSAFFLSGRLSVNVTTPSSGADRSTSWSLIEPVAVASSGSAAPVGKAADAAEPSGGSLTSRQIGRRWVFVSESSVRGDLEWGTTPRLLQSSAERFSAREAIVDVSDGRTLSFAGLATAVHDAARAFLAMGIERGDRVAIWAPNVWEWVVAALGLHSAGAVLVPLNTRFKGREAAYILGKSRAKVLVTITGFLDTEYVALLGEAVDVGTELPDLEAIVVLRGDAPAGTRSWADFLDAGSRVDSSLADARAQAVEPGDLSDILFTSGTTGNPKGAMLTHAQTLRAYRDWSEVVGLQEHDRYLIVNPFFHAFGYKAGWLASLMMGATVLPQAVFDPARVFERIPRDRITVLPGPPTLYQTILNHPGRGDHDLSSLP